MMGGAPTSWRWCRCVWGVGCGVGWGRVTDAGSLRFCAWWWCKRVCGVQVCRVARLVKQVVAVLQSLDFVTRQPAHCRARLCSAARQRNLPPPTTPAALHCRWPAGQGGCGGQRRQHGGPGAGRHGHEGAGHVRVPHAQLCRCAGGRVGGGVGGGAGCVGWGVRGLGLGGWGWGVLLGHPCSC